MSFFSIFKENFLTVIKESYVSRKSLVPRVPTDEALTLPTSWVDKTLGEYYHRHGYGDCEVRVDRPIVQKVEGDCHLHTLPSETRGLTDDLISDPVSLVIRDSRRIEGDEYNSRDLLK